MGTLILVFLAGFVLMGICVWILMPRMMMIKHKSDFDYEETAQQLVDEIEKLGDWKFTSEFDYKKNIEAGGFGKIGRVGSLGLCNPNYASKILSDEDNRKVTSMMPLAVGLYEDKNKKVYISQLNVKMMGMMFGGTIAKVMGIAGKDISAIIKNASKGK